MNIGLGRSQPMEPYTNSLSTANTLPMSSGRGSTHGSHDLKVNSSTPEQDMQRQLDEYNRTVTVVFWYKANTEPIRLQQMMSTFPYFQLSRFGTLTNDLSLSGTSYLDTYSAQSGQWEQHTINTVRLVETQQRLLYRIRKSLLEGLGEGECPSLRGELDLQSQSSCGQNSSAPSTSSPMTPSKMTTTSIRTRNADECSTKTPSKRPAVEPSKTTNPSKIHITESYYISHNGMGNVLSTPAPAGPSTEAPVPSSSSVPETNAINNDSNTPSDSFLYQQPPEFYSGDTPPSAGSSNAPLPQYLTSPPAAAPPIPYHPHPPLKRWPNDYTVSELSSGFLAMDALIAQSPTGASMTQRTAFERVFGSRYVKSTVCRHRAVWRKAHHSLREQFEAMGTDERACWGEFVRRVEGRPPGKTSSATGADLSPTQGVMIYHPQSGPGPGNMIGRMSGQSNGQEGGKSLDEPVMDSLQNSTHQGSGVPMQNTITVYDPSLNHLSTNTRS